MRHHSAQVLFRTHQPALRRHRVPLRLVRAFNTLFLGVGGLAATRTGIVPARATSLPDLTPTPITVNGQITPAAARHSRRAATSISTRNHRPRRHRNRSIQHRVAGRRPRRQPTGIWQPCRDSGAHDGSQWQQSVRLDPTSPGAHTITLIVDVDTFIAESNNSNNSRTVKVTAALHAPHPVGPPLSRS